MRKHLLALLVAGALALSACGDDETAQFTGTVLEQPFTVPDTPLTNTQGEPFSLADDTDARLTLVFFGYTHCPDICHIVMGNIATAVRQLPDDEREQVEVVFVTTDPARDGPKVLRDYLDRFDPSFEGLTGDLDTIIEVADPLAVGIDRKDPGGHTTTTIAIDSADEAPVFWRSDTTAPQFVADIHTLLAG